MRSVKIMCHMCRGKGKHWTLNDEGKPVQLFCEFCNGTGEYTHPVNEEEYERYFREFDCE
jgi:DnaJ-class molecular chaperone